MRETAPLTRARHRHPFSANVKYHFRLVVNVPARTYSVYVTRPVEPELTVGTDFAFPPTAGRGHESEQLGELMILRVPLPCATSRSCRRFRLPVHHHRRHHTWVNTPFTNRRAFSQRRLTQRLPRGRTGRCHGALRRPRPHSRLRLPGGFQTLGIIMRETAPLTRAPPPTSVLGQCQIPFPARVNIPPRPTQYT